MAKLKQAGIRFDLETYQWLEAEAEKTGTTVSALARQGVALLKAERVLMEQMRSQIINQGVTYPSLKKPVADSNTWQQMSVATSEKPRQTRFS